MVIKTILKFDEASFTSNMFDMKAKLTFKDKETNGLKQIVDLSVELAKMMEPPKETEGFDEEEEPEELLEEPEGIEIEPELEEIAPRKK